MNASDFAKKMDGTDSEILGQKTVLGVPGFVKKGSRKLKWYEQLSPNVITNILYFFTPKEIYIELKL